MRYIHTADSDPDTCVILTDFSAISNLQAAKAYTSIVDNQAVLAVYFVLYDFRDATYTDEVGNVVTKKIST